MTARGGCPDLAALHSRSISLRASMKAWSPAHACWPPPSGIACAPGSRTDWSAYREPRSGWVVNPVHVGAVGRLEPSRASSSAYSRPSSSCSPCGSPYDFERPSFALEQTPRHALVPVTCNPIASANGQQDRSHRSAATARLGCASRERVRESGAHSARRWVKKRGSNAHALTRIVLAVLTAVAALGASGEATKGRHTLVLDGRTRSYVVRAPSLDREGPRVPLVLVLHGGGGNAANAERMTGFTQKARAWIRGGLSRRDRRYARAAPDLECRSLL